MQAPEAPIKTDLVLLGGGHSHLFVLEHLAMNRSPGVRVTLVTRDLHTPYSGMLPGFIAGHYERDETHIDLRPLAQRAAVRIVHGEVNSVDTDARLVHVPGRPPLAYDYLSINIGSRPTSLFAEGDPLQLAVKPVDRFIRDWQLLEHRLAEYEAEFRLGIIGGGAGGVELALALQHRAQNLAQAKGRLQLFLVTDRDRLLPGHNYRVQQSFRRILEARGIDVVYEFNAEQFADGQLRAESGASQAADAVVWVTHASPPAWLRHSGLELDANGFIAVNAALQSLSHPEVFAAGDIAAVLQHPRPRSGVFAVRQGPPLARNLARAVAGRKVRPFKPQKQFLSLISTGDRAAVLSRGRWALRGRWCWWLKDRIDRRFMRRFSEFEPMAASEPAGDDAAMMRCGGCGSKLGSGTLEEVLAQLAEEYGLENPGGFDHPDDAALIDVPPGKRLVQTVDQFRSFIDDPYLFGKIAANHACGDLFAMGLVPHSAMVVANVAFASESRQRRDLYQLMAGVVEILQQHGCALAGGHSGEAADMSCGLSVNAFAGDDDPLWLKSGLRAGDVLVLTRELGSGVLFAADMRAQAQGRWIEAALSQMLISSAAAAECLRAFPVGGCTDVTGFGLAGHLFEMTRASACAAEIDLDALPCYAGAAELVERGISSSLQAQNSRIGDAIEAADGSDAHPRYPLLFDPQTAGGLLFGIAPKQAEDCVQALHERGYTGAAVIGRVIEAFDPERRLRLVRS